MLNIDTSFQKAIENFPKWMDIRKRSNTSKGGKYLLSIIEELSDIQSAITDMQKSFFLVNYDGKEDTILAYVFTAQVGADLDLSIDYEDLTLTTDINEFYKNINSTVLYQDGYLAVPENTAKQLNNKIEYYLDERYKYSVDLNSYAVWNIFDEFGMFFGLERLKNESNRELANRCYLVFKNRTNCSEQGLKNTIKNVLSNYEVITDDEIEIINPDELDMLNTKIDGVSIYDSLAELNRDTYRYKKWNHDVWDHDFAHIEYLPHTWDWPLRSFQNGTGNNDDCKIVLGSEENIETTDISVIGYKKSDMLINEYIRNNDVEQVIPVTLTKYNDVLKSNDVQFQITATEVQKIDLSEITIQQYESQEGTNRYYLSDIINYHSDNITEVKNNLLEANTEYRLRFEPTSNFAEMRISKCELVESPEIELLKENSQFELDATGTLINKGAIFHITNVQDFIGYMNMKNIAIEENNSTRNGFTLGTESQIGTFIVQFNKAGSKSVVLDYFCKENNITNNKLYVSYDGFELLGNNTLRSEETDTDNVIRIDLHCNYLSFEVAKEAIGSEQGKCNIKKTVNGKTEILFDVGPETIIIDNGHECLPVSIEVTKNGRNPLTIKNISSYAYKIEHSSSNAKFSWKEKQLILSGITEDTLTFTITSQSAYAPIFNFIHSGSALGIYQNGNFIPTLIYTVDFTTDKETEIDIDSTCNVSLYRMSNGQAELIASPFITKSTYKNDSEQEGYIEIYLNDFFGEYKTTPQIENSRLYLKAGEQIDSIYVQGSTLKNVGSYKLSKLINIENAQFYISNSLNGIIRRDLITEEDSLIQLSRDFLKIRANCVRVDIGNNENISTAFSVNKEDILVYSSEYRMKFSYLRFMNSNDTKYLAHNTISVFMPTIENIEMTNNFSPLLDMNKLVVFQVTSISSEDTEIYFKKKRNDEIIYENWSFGRNELGLSAFSGINFMDTEIYDVEISTERNKYIISQTIPFQIENLAEYVVTIPDNMAIYYESVFYEESFYIEEDGFNKLHYANIERIDEVIVNGAATKSWNVLNTPGIIVWDPNDHTGQIATVRYYYKNPVYMYYTDINDLYKIISYSLSAYEAINRTPLVYSNLKDGDSVSISFGEEKADKIIVSCSNYQFISQIIDNKKITVYHLDYQDKIGIHNGYLYQNGLEYWLFVNKYFDDHDNYNGVILDNVKRYGERFLFSQTATNFLPYSAMEKNIQREVCSIDFSKTTRFGSVSAAGRLTVLNNYSQFTHSGMDASLVSGTNDVAIRFNSKDKNSYAILEITKYLREKSYLSIFGQDVKIFLAEELDAETFKFTKSFCVKIITEIEEKDNVYSVEITPYQKEDTRLYLVFKGSGVIDDLIIKDEEISKDAHKKNIDKIGFSFLNTVKEDFIHELYFTNNNNINGLDISKENDISCGSTVDWSLTQIYKLSEDENIQTFGVQKRFDIYSPAGKNAYLLTAPIFVSNKRSVKDIVIKINELSEAPFKGYDVTLYTFNSSSDIPKQLDKQTADNIFIFKNYTLGSYIQIRIDMPEETKLHEMDVLLKYHEDENNPLIISDRQSGYLITQVYDTGYSDTNYALNNIDFEYIESEEFVQVEMRGCREGEYDSMWSEWKPISFNKRGEVSNSPIFEKYHLFQFKVTLLNPLAKIKINSFNLKVVS